MFARGVPARKSGLPEVIPEANWIASDGVVDAHHHARAAGAHLMSNDDGKPELVGLESVVRADCYGWGGGGL